MNDFVIEEACEKNLNNVTVHIPRNKLVLLTGVSGSGKSTLAMDVLYMECQRQYLEAMAFQGIHKPDVAAVRNASAAILITQAKRQNNPRSTVGTQTDIYTDLRMIYEKLGKRICPFCHTEIYAYNCKEELVKKEQDFTVYMYCSNCHKRMKKITRTYFSYNTKEGACPACEGLGKQLGLKPDNLFHNEAALEDGAVDFWKHRYKDYQIAALKKAFTAYGCPLHPKTKLKDFLPLQRAILEDGVESCRVKKMAPGVLLPKTVEAGKFEGVIPYLYRKVHEKGSVPSNLQAYFAYEKCPQCNGTRLQPLSQSVTVMDTQLSQLSGCSLQNLYDWILKLEQHVNTKNLISIERYIQDLKTKVKRLISAGLGYLNIDRQVMTLSGGEMQRILLAAALDSNLTGFLYILDEPTAGLHPSDTEGVVQILKGLRDKGNTIFVIEHDIDVMKAADWIIDMGPGAGRFGGNVIAEGTYQDILQLPTSVIGQYLSQVKQNIHIPRKGTGNFIDVKNAVKHNLKHVDVRFPLGCLIAVTGVSGSGKSTLVFDVLAKAQKHTEENCVEGLESIQTMIQIEQAPLTRMKRSNIATYVQLYGEIRKLFSELPAAVQAGFTQKEFSFNLSGGRCDYCEGLGYVTSNMLFFEDVEEVCPVCAGKQFRDDILQVKFQGYSIHDILRMTVSDAILVFQAYPKIMKTLQLLCDVGLDYLLLGQTLTTLSTGEGQRLKLARELLNQNHKQTLYLIDEPTIGLHPSDIEKFLILLNRMVDAGNTVIIVEHNQQLIASCDWIIDLGPQGGDCGGCLIAYGTPEEIKKNRNSLTGKYL